MILFVVHWASHRSVAGDMPIRSPECREGKSVRMRRDHGRGSCCPDLLAALSTREQPQGKNAIWRPALTLVLDAASDKCRAPSLKSGRECLAAAGACFPLCVCQAEFYRGWQLCADATVWDLRVRDGPQQIISMRKMVKNRCLPRPENYYLVQLSKGIEGFTSAHSLK